MDYLVVKSIHIIFVVTWFAGLFYMPRLFVYAAEANQEEGEKKRILLEQYRLMQKRLWYGITWPSAVLTFIFGMWMFHLYGIANWLLLKLAFVLGLYLYHLSLQIIFQQQQKGIFKYSGQQMRVWNEVATVFLFAIVFLVVMKDTMGMVYGLLGMFGLIAVLMAGITLYKKTRKKN